MHDECGDDNVLNGEKEVFAVSREGEAVAVGVCGGNGIC